MRGAKGAKGARGAKGAKGASHLHVKLSLPDILVIGKPPINIPRLTNHVPSTHVPSLGGTVFQMSQGLLSD